MFLSRANGLKFALDCLTLVSYLFTYFHMHVEIGLPMALVL